MQTASLPAGRNQRPFIGRQEELQELHGQLSRGAGLITLIGPSGIGKTRLARQLAQERLEADPGEGRIFFCSLASCTDASDLEAEVARTLAIWQRSGDELASAIASRGPLVLILDNADPIASRCAEVIERWLERCVELQLIVTSLLPLEAQGEVVFELKPLDPDDAVRLYLDRAKRAWADRVYSQEELAEVRELVHRLDRLPLAIELAAARVRILPPRAMLSMFERRFEILRSGRPRSDAANPRTSSLFGACEITWNHLTPQEQLALARASVFEGGFDFDAAKAIVADAGVEEEPSEEGVAEILEGLTRKSLLHCEESEVPRYSLLESIKEYALRELERMGRFDEAVRRHASYYLEQARYHVYLGEPGTGKVEEAESLAWLRRERTNLLAVFHRFRGTDPVLAARVGLSLFPLLHWEGNPDPDAELPRSILATTRESGLPNLLLRAPSFVGRLHYQYGRFDKAAHFFGQAVRRCQEFGDEAMEAKAWSNLAVVHLGAGDLEESRRSLEQALALCETLNLPQVEGEIRLAQGMEALQRGALEEAEASYTRAADLLGPKRIGVRANIHYGLGLTYANRRQFPEARRMIDTALAECRALGYRAFEAHILAHLAQLELADGDLAQAESICLRSLEIHREIGNRYREGEGHCTLGAIALEREDLEAAAEWLDQADKRFTECGASASHPELLVFHAALELKRGRYDDAQRTLEEALQVLRADARQASPLTTESVQAFLDLSLAWQSRATDPAQAETFLASARSLLAQAEAVEPRLPSYLAVFPRLLAQELARWGEGAATPLPARPRARLEIGADHGWFRVSEGPRVELRNRRVLRRIFSTLVRARLESPGSAVDPHDLVDQVWPGVGMIPGRATKRLYMAMLLLRDLGLRSNILTVESGYLLDPQVPLRVVDEAGPAIVSASSPGSR